jgi:hypothetical protein
VLDVSRSPASPAVPAYGGQKKPLRLGARLRLASCVDFTHSASRPVAVVVVHEVAVRPAADLPDRAVPRLARLGAARQRQAQARTSSSSSMITGSRPVQGVGPHAEPLTQGDVVLRGLMKAEIARRVIQEARKPQNQAKAKQLLSNLKNKNKGAAR